MKIKISDIQIGEGRREVDNNAVVELVKSIELVGLINPITVSADMVLVAGAHRLEAFKRLGRSEIPANIVELDDLKLRLAEIDENLVRKDLHYIDKCNQLAERKEIYEALYPETKQGGDRKSEKIKTNPVQFDIPSFADDTAKKLGVDPRTIQQNVQIAESLTDESKQAAKELDLKKKEAVALARMSADEQKDAIDKRAKGEVKDVRELAKPMRTQSKPQPSNDDLNKPLTKKQIEEAIRSIKDPEITSQKAFTCDSRAAELANHISVFAYSLGDYAKGSRSINGLSEESKKKVTAAISQMETAVTSIKKYL